MTAARGSAAQRPAKPEKAPGKHRIVVPFDDNRLLAHLLGEYDSHLALIESRLGIEAHAHGNVVTLTGPQPACEIGRTVLNQIYDRVRKGETVTPGDIDGLIRHARSGPPAGSGTGTAQVRTRKRIVTARTPMQSDYIRALDRHDLVFGIGPAGTGKTYLAIAKAVEALEDGKIERIMLSRPAVEAGESLGYLPGDLEEKLAPYLRPLYDALSDRVGRKRLKSLLTDGSIEIAPVAYMRGRTLNNAFIVIDEAQNCTYGQIKMLLTRLGWHSTMVLTGDPDQTDLLPGMSGLSEIAARLETLPDLAVVRLQDKDIVRHPLVASMLTVL